MSDLFGLNHDQEDGGIFDGYVALRLSREGAKAEFIQDLDGIEAARWLTQTIRNDIEEACYGAKIYGPAGTWDGMLTDAMPNFWRQSEEAVSLGQKLWKPDGRHPVGKWFDDAIGRLMQMPPPEILDAVLRRHGIVGSKEPFPTMRLLEDGDFAILVHKPKEKSLSLPGVARDPGLLIHWSPKLANAKL